jgi:hypothetical protein
VPSRILNWLTTRPKWWGTPTVLLASVLIGLATDTFLAYLGMIALFAFTWMLASVRGYDQGLESGTQLMHSFVDNELTKREVINRSRSEQMLANAKWN